MFCWWKYCGLDLFLLGNPVEVKVGLSVYVRLPRGRRSRCLGSPSPVWLHFVCGSESSISGFASVGLCRNVGSELEEEGRK